MSGKPEQRTFDRVRGRIPCSLRIGEASHAGIATNLSASGLLLQTRVRLKPGTPLTLSLDLGGKTLLLTGSVVRVQASHRAAVAVAQPGIGFLIETAPEAYFQLVLDLYGVR